MGHKTIVMNCWICGKVGNTGEHLIKASDLKSIFGEVSQKTPLYFHTSKTKNVPVGSIKRSSRLRSNALLCNDCNSSLTQPYDKAWETMSAYLRNNWGQISASGKVNLSNVFLGNVRKSLLNVHLYFVKIFGCSVVADGVPIDITPFRKSLLLGKPHKNVYLAICHRPGQIEHKYAGIVPITSLNKNGKSLFAASFYSIDQFSVNILYVTQDRPPNVMQDTFHPDKFKMILKIKDFAK